MLLAAPLAAGAQTELDPANPPEPQLSFQVTVSAEPAEAGYTSGGAKYTVGQQVYVSTSVRNSNYEFLYWTRDGVRTDDPMSFSFTMGDRKVSYVAVYGLNPKDPAEPTAPNTFRLYLDTDAEGCCTFNRASGEKQRADQYVSVAAQNVSPGYVFQGWFAGGQKVGDNLSFNYLMPYSDMTLTARFVFNPTSPADPSSSAEQQSIDNGRLGDVNNDGVVNVSDAVLLINHYLNNTTDELPVIVADVNRDGVVNVSDAVEIVNRYLNNQ